jgi:hypothetical protein
VILKIFPIIASRPVPVARSPNDRVILLKKRFVVLVPGVPFAGKGDLKIIPVLPKIFLK